MFNHTIVNIIFLLQIVYILLLYSYSGSSVVESHKDLRTPQLDCHQFRLHPKQIRFTKGRSTANAGIEF